MIVLSLTEEDRDLLLLLSPEQRDSVLLSLLTGKENFSFPAAKSVYKQIKKRELAREASRKTSKRHRDSHRDNHCDVAVTVTPPSPPSPPFLPPSPSSPEPPLSSPPYNPPSSKEKGRNAPKRFTPPAVEEVKAYCLERKNGLDAQSFVDFYASKGWKVGKEPMKDWKAAVRTWENRRKCETTKKETSFDMDLINKRFELGNVK